MTPAVSTSPVPSADEVRQIAAIGNPVIRNLRITECYHRLSLAIAARTGSFANWCTFAIWASRQAGRTIRGEDLLDRLTANAKSGWTPLHPVRSLWRALLRRGIFYPETRLGRLVREVHSPFDVFERASDAVSRGNLKVFAEIGLEFARYLEQCPDDGGSDSPAFEVFLETLRAGEPPDGQEYLRRAFVRYRQLSSFKKPPESAQQMLLANLEIGLHEQTRLQPEIQQAMESAPETAKDLGERVRSALFPGTRRLTRWIRLALAFTIGVSAASFKRFARDLTRRVVTESLMVITIPPRVVIGLSRHLEYEFPNSLGSIDNPELQSLLSRFEPARAEKDDCGADDWSDLRQRMHFIAHLFRAFHERPELFEAPFTAEQMELCRSGVVPRGEL